MSLIENDEEILYRKIYPASIFWDNEHNRPSSAAYKDKKGLSVDRLGDREENEVIDSFIKRFGDDKVKSVVKVSVGICKQLELYPIDKPSFNNKYHAEIHDSKTRIEISQSKAKKLAENVHIVYP
ncbi:hypothetical protein OFR29_11365 [Brachyspira hyodysenteriae]|nr:hypothetical protein [Brachyspira hyodysenteriae]MCZ9892874.1 hypothetical protein [Brachyspira hyodysenteriae]MCZ9990421.1 hypothetical protein [Brachyspira hyodysenteriae]MCZ9998788.1 hypothetical protein [Brachyspira hyodysenteriae]MCZ9999911.1 hypothetical protein [Brachyspira hyodysenteriae]MDA0007227.1 hypothetical protein [Brachyspira hyodysenteriae]